MPFIRFEVDVFCWCLGCSGMIQLPILEGSNLLQIYLVKLARDPHTTKIPKGGRKVREMGPPAISG